MIGMDSLDGIDLFEGLPDEQLKGILEVAEEVSCQEGRTLFNEGQTASEIYILLEGEISIQVKLSSRPENMAIVRLNKRGAVVGWSGMISPNDYTASAHCNRDARLLALDGAAFMALLEDNPVMGFTIMRRLLKVVSGRLRNIQRVVLKTL